MPNRLRVASGMAILAVLALAIVIAGVSTRFSNGTVGHAAASLTTKTPGISLHAQASRLVANYGKLPLSFEANIGQTGDQVKFLTRGPGYTLFLKGDEAVLSLTKTGQKSNVKPLRPGQGQQTSDALQMKLVGARADANLAGLDPLPGKVNYFIGNDPRNWRANIPTYARVLYRNVYPGVDLVYYGHQGRLEYDFVVAPGADPNAIRLKLGTRNSKLETRKSAMQHPQSKIAANGDLIIPTAAGDVRFQKPVVYQESEVRSREAGEQSHRELVDGRFVLSTSNEIRFALGRYDKSKTLVIDPGLIYSSFNGGTGTQSASAIAVDLAGNTFLALNTTSGNLPVSIGPTTIPNSGGTPYVAKVNATGTALVYATFLGGTKAVDVLNALALDATDNVYLTGTAHSADFPTSTGAFMAALGNTSGSNAFVTKLGPTGAVAYSTFLGGTEDLSRDSTTKACNGANNGKGNDSGASIAVDALGDAYVGGTTGSCDFPTTASAFLTDTANVSTNNVAFLTKVKPDGTGLLFSTLLGGTGGDAASSVAIDGTGAAYVAGSTASKDFPTAPATPLQAALKGSQNAFVAKFAPSGATLDYSTYLGGSGSDGAVGVAVDTLENAYVAGKTSSTNFPVTATPVQAACGNTTSCANGFAAKLDPAGTALVYATYLGGSASDNVNALAVDASGDAILAGATTSANFPVKNAVQATFNSTTVNSGYETGTSIGSITAESGTGGDAFVTVVGPTGASLVFSTYLGGSDNDAATAVTVGSTGIVYLAGNTSSVNFPVTNTVAFIGTHQDVFVSKIDLSAAATPAADVTPSSLVFPSQVVGTQSTGVGTTASPQVVTVKNTGATALTISKISFPVSTLYSETDNCTTSAIAAGASCTADVTFTPDTTGEKTGLMSVTYAGTGSPQMVTLVGFGGDYELLPAPASITINSGLTATFNVQVVPLNGFNQTVNFSCGGAPTNSSCKLSSSSLTFDGKTTQTVTGTLDTAASLLPPGPSAPGGPDLPSAPWLIVWLAALLVSASGLVWSKRSRKPIFALATVALAMALWASCATKATTSGSTAKTTPPGNYTLTIDATWTGGTLAHSLSIPLTVD